MLIGTNVFTGTRPRVGAKLLENHQAQIAKNCDLRSGELRARKNTSAVTSINGGPTVALDGGTIKTLFLYENQYLCSWDDVVHVVRGPVKGDSSARIYWTGDTADSGKPKMGYTPFSVTGTPPIRYPSNYYRLGIPKPAAAPTLVIDSSEVDQTEAEMSPGLGYQNWTAGNNAALSNDASGNLKVAYNGTNIPYAYRNFTVVSGAMYHVVMSTAEDGVAQYPQLTAGLSAAANQLADLDLRKTPTTDVDGTLDTYVIANGTTLTLTIFASLTAAGYALLGTASVKRVLNMSHAAVNVMTDDASAGTGAWTAVNSALAAVSVYSIGAGRDDNAISVTNSGALAGQAARTYAIPTVSGRTYKAAVKWIPFNVTTGNLLVGTTYGNGQYGSDALAATLGTCFIAGSGLSWEFNNTDDGWVSTNITPTNNTTWIALAATSGDPQFKKTGLSFSGTTNRFIATRFKRTSGVGWVNDLSAYYHTAGHGRSGSYYALSAVATAVQGEYVVVYWDMWQLQAGGNDWKDSTITGIEIDYVSTNGATWEVDWIAVGNPADLEVTFVATQSTAFITLTNSAESNALSYYVAPHVDQISGAILCDVADQFKRTYVYTYVSGIGEEGEPSDGASVDGICPGQAVSLSALSTGPAGPYNITHKNIYRSVTTSEGTTELQYVTQIPVATTTYSDSLTDSQLGEVLSTSNWVAPVDTLSNLTELSSSMLAGSDTAKPKDVWICEPFVPYSWPNRQAVNYDVVGMCGFGTSLAVLTKGVPYVATGTDPTALTLERMNIEQACAAQRSIARWGDLGVMYASPDGIMLLNASGAELISAPFLTAKEWAAYAPSSIHGYVHDGQYFGFYDTGSATGGFIFDPKESGAGFQEITTYATAGHVDLLSDSLYLVVGGSLVKWEGNSTLMTYTWKSKKYELPRHTNLAWGQVTAASYASLTLKVYADGVLKHTQTVTNSDPFPLPSGFLAKEWEFELSGTDVVTSAYLANSVAELRSVS